MVKYYPQGQKSRLGKNHFYNQFNRRWGSSIIQKATIVPAVGVGHTLAFEPCAPLPAFHHDVIFSKGGAKNQHKQTIQKRRAKK